MVSCFVLAKLFSAHYPSAPLAAFVGYLVVWLIVAAFNMWVGISKAGYSAREEFPIFLLIFGVPAVLATAAKWKVL